MPFFIFIGPHLKDADGNPIGRANELPPLDTRRYVVELEDGDEMELAANVIAQRMVEDVDVEGNDLLMLEALWTGERMML